MLLFHLLYASNTLLYIHVNYLVYTFTVEVAVRLVNGPTIHEGRVEVYYNGEWGTVCHDGWDLNDAEVVCSELGYGYATAALYNAFYGQGGGQIWFKYLRCVGTEDTIRSCWRASWRNYYCRHYEDASVRCSSGNVLQLIIIEKHMYGTS